jgi:hypothetical protein
MFPDHLGGVASGRRQMSRIRAEVYSSKRKNVPDLFGGFDYRGQMGMIVCAQTAALRNLGNLIERRPQFFVIVSTDSRNTLRPTSYDQVLSTCVAGRIGYSLDAS